MGYETFQRLPYLSTHAEAAKRLAATKPIRKTKENADGPTIYPLAERKDNYKFSIRKVGDADTHPNPSANPNSRYQPCPGAQDGDIELLLYRMTLITFHQDDTLTIHSMYTHWNSADTYFIREILRRYLEDVVTNRGRLVMTPRIGDKIVIPHKGHLRLRYATTASTATHTHTLTPVAAPVLTTYRLNRKATNEVRARYGEFYRYVKGMVALRKERKENRYYDYHNEEQVVDITYTVSISEEELESTLSLLPSTRPDKLALATKPAINTATYKAKVDGGYEQAVSREPYEHWLAGVEAFLTLVRTSAEDPEQHEKFRQAFVWLAFVAGKSGYYRPKSFSVEAQEFGKTLDEIIFKYHSEEVFEKVQAKQGSVPSVKYDKWVTREHA